MYKIENQQQKTKIMLWRSTPFQIITLIRNHKSKVCRGNGVKIYT